MHQIERQRRGTGLSDAPQSILAPATASETVHPVQNDGRIYCDHRVRRAGLIPPGPAKKHVIEGHVLLSPVQRSSSRTTLQKKKKRIENPSMSILDPGQVQVLIEGTDPV
jgi:hypothetical protein